MSAEIHEIEWRGIKLSVSYAPAQWGITSHIEVESIAPERAPLPITETGYRSHFVPIGTVEEQFPNVCEFVMVWLDERAQSDEWRLHVQQSAQGELF